MKVEHCFDVGCYFCGRHQSTDYGRGVASSVRQARIWAKKDGWTELRNGEPVCPECKGLHFYEVFTNPRHGYAYPVVFASNRVLTPEEAMAEAAKECYFLCDEDAGYLELGTEITREQYLSAPAPDKYIKQEYGGK